MTDSIRKKLTLKDVALELSVTPATVSKALRDSSDISLDMRDKVKAKVKEMGYRPNLLARTLINKSSKILGILIPDLRISFFSEAVRGMYEEANKKGYETILLVHDENKNIERKKLEFLSDIHSDGILLNSTCSKSNYPLYNKLVEEGIKIVCWDRNLDGLNFSSVTIDDRTASFLLTESLIKKGRKNILFLGPKTGIEVVKERYDGYKSALKQYGIELNQKLVVQTFRNYSDSYHKMSALIESKIKFDAIVSIGGLITYGAGRAVLDHGLNIPKDIILGEFGDNNIVTRLGVPFSTVFQNPYLMGKTSVDMLIKQIETKKMTEIKHVIIDSEIYQR